MKSRTEANNSKHSKLDFFSCIFGVVGILIGVYSIFSSNAMERRIKDAISTSDSEYFLKLSEIIKNKRTSEDEKLAKVRDLHASYKKKILAIVEHSVSSSSTERQDKKNKPSIKLGQDVKFDTKPKIKLGQEVRLDSKSTIIVDKKDILDSSHSNNKSGTK